MQDMRKTKAQLVAERAPRRRAASSTVPSSMNSMSVS